MRIFVCAAMLCASAAMGADNPVRNVGVNEVVTMMEQKTNVVLDVRTPKEYQAGHLKGAKLIDFNAPDFEQNIATLDKSQTYIVHCASGNRSAKAARKMKELGFSNVVNFAPGFKGWEKAGKPIER